MKTKDLLEFSVDKENKKVKVEREFADNLGQLIKGIKCYLDI